MRNKWKRLLLTIMLTASLACITVVKGHAADINVETVVLSRDNTTLIARNIELTTYRGIEISGQLNAIGAENTDVTFKVTQEPKYGVLKIGDDGEFKYDPLNTRHAKDTFSYVVLDLWGKQSNEATVTVNIEKQKSDVTYADMENNPRSYAAVYLAENGIYTGKRVGEDYFFQPDVNVTKGEFLSMCLKASNHHKLCDVQKTGLTNDAILPVWAKNTVSTAVLCGCFTGGNEFEYNSAITYEEAVEILNSVFEITDVIAVSEITQYYRQATAQAVNNLYFCGVVDKDIVKKYDTVVTMADAAVMLERANQIFKNR